MKTDLRPTDRILFGAAVAGFAVCMFGLALAILIGTIIGEPPMWTLTISGSGLTLLGTDLGVAGIVCAARWARTH